MAGLTNDTLNVFAQKNNDSLKTKDALQNTAITGFLLINTSLALCLKTKDNNCSYKRVGSISACTTMLFFGDWVSRFVLVTSRLCSVASRFVEPVTSRADAVEPLCDVTEESVAWEVRSAGLSAVWSFERNRNCTTVASQTNWPRCLAFLLFYNHRVSNG